MRDYSKYEVWNDAILIAKKVYQLTERYPESEKYGMTSQMRRASVSVSSNIAEGCSRSSEKDFKRFLEISIGSLFELNSQIHLSTELSFCKKVDVLDLLNLITQNSKQLSALKSKVEANGQSQWPK